MSSPNQNQIVFFDTTLRDDEQSPGCTMHHEEKLREAHQIAVLGDHGDQHDRPDDEEQPSSDKTRAERSLSSVSTCLPAPMAMEPVHPGCERYGSRSR
jgi:hypothetical protein